MSAVQVSDLTVRYGDVSAVSSASFAVQSGETVALVGANGAGKSSTFNALLGVVPLAGGSVSVFGLDPATQRAALARRWGVMPQTGGLPMGLRVGECVDLFAQLYGRGNEAAEAVAACGLADVAGRKWRTLSGGQQQRLSLAIALVGGRDLLVLDEPTAALDVEGQERVLQLVSERADGGAAVVLSTHRFDEVEQVADRVVVLSEGVVVANATVDELTLEAPEVRLGGASANDADRINAALETSFSIRGDEAVWALPPSSDPQAALRRVLDWCAANDVATTSASVGSRSLADAYRELVGE